ncbi:general secretion pathway protein J [Sinorhizobium terangae]|uniref:Prepilin-type N-terminal cleavage/methylation domain-containing protein n=1 Tax=Sinorhizobium terangae TaxID=110322 RepID=A0A6N7LBH7_SINTE|nr:prepilin-type N-terminal cleavage/methylation domain-containing protein [Sinorhizobium terangae]MBB4187335.1 general secretion pathway protein J [Sinorhizobium terangae]MQX14650.1 prepilin-type N-terminal cleavage/methylation domain-containing protein [Sinorhizobium terangae]
MSITDASVVAASRLNGSCVPPTPLSSASQCGYTLVEVLVVLAIASIMAAMMIGGVRQLQGLLHQGERSATQSIVDAVADRVADDLAGALELPLLGSASDQPAAMVGSPHEVRFNAVVRTGFRKRALREVVFSVEALQRTLVRTSLPRRLGEAERTRRTEKHVLHPDITEITFRYMTRETNGKPAWLDDWSGRTFLPIAVQFQIELSARGEQIKASRTVGMLR